MTMTLAGVIGWPVGHSLSPALHGFWLGEHRIDGAYVPLPVRREDFARVVDGLARAGFAGLNVTIPHKEAAFAIAHDCDDAAALAGAVNLLLFKDGGRIEGRNVDAAGLAASLAEGLGADALRGQIAVVIGAGGAARAAVLALDGLGAKTIRIVNRHAVRADALAQNFAGRISAQIATVLWSDWEQAAAGASLLLNATSAGMRGTPSLDLALAPLAKDAAVCDVVYNPLDTPLLKAARARGHRVVDGLGMLMHQAVPAFAAFYGVTPKVTPALRAELERALGHVS
jgi:shikimate dehydrogenase